MGLVDTRKGYVISSHRYGAGATSALVALTTLVLSMLAAVAHAPTASAQGVDPDRNIPISHSMSDTRWYFGHTTCEHAPLGSRCESAVLRALGRARAALGKGAYTLPARFEALRPATQLLVLVNDDRRSYGRTPVAGLADRLNAAARRGAHANAEPAPVGSGWTSAATNWAGGMASPLFAYYSWMYGDGLSRDGSSNNVDCGTAHRSGCWSHRDNMLRRYGRHTRLMLGVGHANTRTGPSWTQLFQAYPR